MSSFTEEQHMSIFTDKQLEELSKLRQTIFDMVDEYNSASKFLDFHERLAIMSAESEEGYISVHDDTGWFPSSIC